MIKRKNGKKKDATPPWCWRWFRHFPMSPPRPLESQISTRLSGTCKGQAASGKRQKVGCCPDQHAHSTHGLNTDNFHSFRSYVAFPTSHRIRRSPLKFLANPWRKVAHQKNPEIIESLNSMAMCLGQAFTIIRWRCNSQNMYEYVRMQFAHVVSWCARNPPYTFSISYNPQNS